jgi:regulator of cell morphogenesis and NO signaling
MLFDEQMTVGDIVLRHPETARVFERHRIDFCCGGQVRLAQACERAGLDGAAILEALEIAAKEIGAPRHDVSKLPTASLIATIIHQHHDYLREAMPRIQAQMAKVASVHGEHNPKLRSLEPAVSELCETLAKHLDAEERVLFPALLAGGPALVIARELASMVEDHLAVGAALRNIRALADDFVVPEWGCTTYRLLFSGLAEMEADIHLHVHLENNVLLPRFAKAS